MLKHQNFVWRKNDLPIFQYHFCACIQVQGISEKAASLLLQQANATYIDINSLSCCHKTFISLTSICYSRWVMKTYFDVRCRSFALVRSPLCCRCLGWMGGSCVNVRIVWQLLMIIFIWNVSYITWLNLTWALFLLFCRMSRASLLICRPLPNAVIAHCPSFSGAARHFHDY